ncbi:MAG: serine/threonine-protein kinase, partial [Pseudomonadota bacterium]
MNSRDVDALEGSALGKYQILTRVGAGNMAAVYLGHDPFIDRPVAVKVAHPQAIDHREDGDFFKQLFFNEAQTAGLLKHPNITSIYDAGVDREWYYIVMEYVHGGNTLEEFCRAPGLLSIQRITKILYQAAMALDYAHRKGVVHRDIKPRNVLLTEDGDVKITDFGVAVAPTDASTDQEHAGSPLYMSPEQVRREAVNGQSDLFSLGVVAYELLVGNHPFQEANIDAIEHRILNTPPTVLAERRSGIPDIYQRIIDKALAKDTS